MSDVCTGVFAKRGVVPEDVVGLSVFTFNERIYYYYSYIYELFINVRVIDATYSSMGNPLPVKGLTTFF